MAFKSIKAYNEERYGGKFIMQNDGDVADVIFLYPSEDDVLIADAHYVKSSDYTGYVHHIETGCPACAKGFKVQTRLFIPMYVIRINNEQVDEIRFWDRPLKFNVVMHENVFKNYPNPSEYVFRITRHGIANDRGTTYEITAIAKNTMMSYSEILAKFNAKMPDYYDHVIKEVSADTLAKMISSNVSETPVSDTYEMPKYQITPRVAVVNRTETPDEVSATEIPETVESLDDDDEVSFD